MRYRQMIHTTQAQAEADYLLPLIRHADRGAKIVERIYYNLPDNSVMESHDEEPKKTGVYYEIESALDIPESYLTQAYEQTTPYHFHSPRQLTIAEAYEFALANHKAGRLATLTRAAVI